MLSCINLLGKHIHAVKKKEKHSDFIGCHTEGWPGSE